MADEYFDVVDETGAPTGVRKHRKQVHKDGDWHRSAHVWLYVISTEELLIQKRAEFKDSWAGKWDISAAGHVVAGKSTFETAMAEFFEELGIKFPKEAFEPLFTVKVTANLNDGAFVNNEFADVFLVTVKDRIPVESFVLDEVEVEAVKYIKYSDLAEKYREQDPSLVPADMNVEGCVVISPNVRLVCSETTWAYDENVNRVQQGDITHLMLDTWITQVLHGKGLITKLTNTNPMQYKCLFDIIKSRAARQGLVGSGSYTFFHQPKGETPVQIQCVTFDETYLNLIPADKR